MSSESGLEPASWAVSQANHAFWKAFGVLEVSSELMAQKGFYVLLLGG